MTSLDLANSLLLEELSLNYYCDGSKAGTEKAGLTLSSLSDLMFAVGLWST